MHTHKYPKENITIEDIKGIGKECNIELTPERMQTILKEYNRVVTDKAEDWCDILKELISN
jgi:hypothetical protein